MRGHGLLILAFTCANNAITKNARELRPGNDLAGRRILNLGRPCRALRSTHAKTQGVALGYDRTRRWRLRSMVATFGLYGVMRYNAAG